MQSESPSTTGRPYVVPLLAGGVGLALQVAYVLTLEGDALHSLETIRDALYYDMRAGEIARGDLLGSTAEYLSPLYGFVLGLIKLVGLESAAAMRFGQSILVGASATLVAWVAQRHFGRRVGLVAGIGYALYPATTYYGAEILPTTLVVLVNLLVLAVYPDDDETASHGRLFLVGLIAGLAALAKANALLLVGVLALGHVFIASQRSQLRAWIGAALIVAGSVTAIAPVTLKNALVSQRFVLITTSGGVNILKGNGPRATGAHVFIERGDTLPSVGLLAHLDGTTSRAPGFSVDASRKIGDDALTFMLDNPRRTLRLFARKFYYFWHDREFFIRDDFRAARKERLLLSYPYPGYGLLVALAALALPLLPWKRALWPLVAMLAVQAASFTLVFVLARYRLVTVALLFILASAGLARLPLLWREGARKRVAMALALGALVATLTLWPLAEPTAPPADDGTPAPDVKTYP